ncbi:MAG: N-acetylglucosamine-6-phosphate deacetylase [Oscillospiraceae bacterium]|nr:N-acetylglucosamine-6-phosphate deacetylase [Oscillospiraceae bacterium]MCL2279799.1 N-acetylglucosamine-6-phosphate deacetylase [Oscillospiraceae bacterium]
MIIKNANVYCKTGKFEKGDITIEGEYIAKNSGKNSEKNSGEIIDAEGLMAIPGLVDIHLHGCVGKDFSDADEEGLREMLRFEASQGITSVCPATLTLAEEKLSKACKRISTVTDEKGSAVVGIQLEGPFLSYNKRGAQNPDYLCKPEVEMVDRLQKEANGLIKLIAIAPELDGALEVINKLSNKGIRVSLAHSEAGYETAMKGLESGARQVTHLFNGMAPFHHRDPGLIGAARDFELCTPELICDGEHVHPGVVRATFAMFSDERIIMVSDSMMATGMEDGIWNLGGLEVEVKGTRAALTSNDSIAGSVTHLMQCLKIAVKKMKIPLESAIKCCTINPAKAIGADDKRGSIEVNKYADVVLLDNDLNIKKIILRGKELKD